MSVAVLSRKTKIPGCIWACAFVTGEAGVVVGIGFVVGAIVGNSANDFFGVIPACEGALGICPIGFGLAAVAWRKFPHSIVANR
jgi:hypothetical protein